MMNRRVGMWALMVSAAMSSGCGSARPIKYYQLTVPGGIAPAADAGAFPITLSVGPLTASHLYREDQIVYSSAGERMGLYQSQRWAEPPTEMIQEVVFRE